MHRQALQATVNQQATQDVVGLGWIALPAIALVLLALALILRREQRARRSINQRVSELSTLSDAGRAIVAAQLDVDELCMLIYRQARQLVDTWIFQLGLFEGSNYHIKVWIVRGERQPETSFNLDDSEGIIGWMRRTGQPLLVRDYQTEMDSLPARPRYFSDDPPRSAVFVPLIAGEKIIGAMAIQSHRPSAFTEDHRRLLSIIANQAAAAIANAGLFQAERRRRQVADTLRQVSSLINSSLETDEILHGILEGLEQLVTFEAASILLLNEDQTFTLRAARGLPVAVEAVGQKWPVAGGRRLRRLADEKQPIIFDPDAEIGAYHQLLGFPPDHSCLGAPIVTRDQMVGVLSLDHREPGQFDANDAVLVAAVASHAASALENARLYAAGQEEAWISTALLEVAEATGFAKSVDEVLETVVRITPMLIGVDRCAILLWDRDHEVCKVAATYEPPDQDAYLQVDQAILPGDWVLLDQLWESGAPVVDEFGAIPGAPTTQDVETTLLALPLRAQGELTGAMVIGFTDQVSFSEYRIKLIAGIANQAAMAIESAQLVVALQEEAWVSLALLQVAEAVANLSELDDVLNVITRLTPLLVGVESCLIYLWEAQQQVYVPSAAYGVQQDRMTRFWTTPILAEEWPQVAQASPGDVGAALREDDEQQPWESNGHPLLIPGPPAPLASSLGLRNPFALSLQTWGETMGVVVIDAPDGDIPLSGKRLNILSGVAQQTATAIQNVRLQIESIERQKLERELELARQIQASFLPGEIPRVSGWDLAAFWQGARQVSGDFYDFVPLPDQDRPDRYWGFVIADVADKGVPAALFMALSRTLVRTMAIGGEGPAAVLAQANDMIMADSRSDLFVTLFYAILDPEQGLLTYANAGHNHPLHFVARSGDVIPLTAQGMALGVIRGIDLEQRQEMIEPGDVLLFYTDGVTDALNADMDEFGLARLRRVVEAHCKEPTAAIVRAINHAVAEFVGDTPQFDDLTLVVLKREPL